MKNRLFENWITSIMGIGVFIFAGVLLYQTKIDYLAFGTMCTLALTLLRAKDSLIPGVNAK
jgi:hypothetical protein